MPLLMDSRIVGEVLVIKCRGRIIAGSEALSLHDHVRNRIPETPDIVLQLAETAFVDSCGMGTLVRLLFNARAASGDLKLCAIPEPVLNTLRITNLHKLFEAYESEEEAIAACHRRPRRAKGESGRAELRIVCVDDSVDVLAYLSELLLLYALSNSTPRFCSKPPGPISLLWGLECRRWAIDPHGTYWEISPQPFPSPCLSKIFRRGTRARPGSGCWKLCAAWCCRTICGTTEEVARKPSRPRGLFSCLLLRGLRYSHLVDPAACEVDLSVWRRHHVANHAATRRNGSRRKLLAAGIEAHQRVRPHSRLAVPNDSIRCDCDPVRPRS